MPRFRPILLILFAWPFLASGQSSAFPLSDSAFVSLVTVAPGEELYSTFGHSALRVKDPARSFDRCYNYGTFDFDQPNFYLNFCRGKLLYYLNLERHRDFEYGNLLDHRAMQEQILNLDPAEKQRLFDLLQENALPQNREYKYDFFYDNCATRIRDIVEKALLYQVFFDSTSIERGQTMRQLLRPYLADKPWTQFGIDLVLGQAADRVAQPKDFMFLPDHLHTIFGATRLPDGRGLVLRETRVPPQGFQREAFKPGWLDHPLLITTILALLGLFSLSKPRLERIFDPIFWFVLGTLGLVMLLLWVATDHSATKTNWNILWALPTHLLYFWRRTKSEFVENYFTGVSILAALTVVFWFVIPQELPIAALPIAVLVAVQGTWRRYWRKEKKEEDEA
ncbi:MAG: DUF4105 domain-containing protein [Saprospiraceae bacterium]|nr:DUF4105 domain-containing protein [Saprospiraceae bacterium]